MLVSSNSLADLAERIAALNGEAQAAEKSAAAAWLSAGELLIEARHACQHGDWLPFLERAGMAERKAQRLMQVARSGLKPDTVSDLGGLRGALAYLAARRLPDEGEVTIATRGPLQADSPLVVYVRSAGQGLYHLEAVTDDGAQAWLDQTRQPVDAEPRRLDGAGWIVPVWLYAEFLLATPPAGIEYLTMAESGVQ